LKSAHRKSFGHTPSDSGVPGARWRGPPPRLSKAVAIELGMDRAPGENADIAIELPDQE
jgi:hypothetical protein